MTTQLEGPGSEQRLRALRRGFRRAGPEGRRAPAGLFVGVFVLVFLGTLAVLERPSLISTIGRIAALPGNELDREPAPYRYFSGCDEARAAGAAPIYRWQSGYREEMDGDNDGVACEPYY